MKKLTRPLLYLAILVLAYWALGQMNLLPSFSGLFKAKPVLIDDTPVLVEQIKQLSQLVTITAYDEVVVHETITNTRIINNPGNLLPIPLQTTGQLVLVGRGKVLAGINFDRLKATDCFIKGDSVSIRLPAAEVLSAIMNPSDFETFSESGSWSPEAVTAVKIKAREKMVSRAIQQQILSKAGAKARETVTGFLRLMGFVRIHVHGA